MHPPPSPKKVLCTTLKRTPVQKPPPTFFLWLLSILWFQHFDLKSWITVGSERQLLVIRLSRCSGWSFLLADAFQFRPQITKQPLGAFHGQFSSPFDSIVSVYQLSRFSDLRDVHADPCCPWAATLLLELCCQPAFIRDEARWLVGRNPTCQ